MLCFPEEGGNDAYWDKWADKTEAELGTLFIRHDLKRFGLTQTRFEHFVKASQLRSNAADVASGDPFSPIRRFADAWNNTMANVLSPGDLLLVDESMGQWKGMGMPGLMFVMRKPTPLGREMHTTACCATGVLIRAEIYEGKE
ncbi:hypothetical protein CYMTET_35530 [Cymbomonas tetramitiformis]|uniref:PiggyBac transposable element-derived protein domain-containing protein n=1 Tax=Cymbomonas tetramitiformis TaxID=36881 RepID=A0AAE0F921_9CHLO|nr:hypothetical protein CYMTET_35530 [Cymbomonas tetramitiformis]